MRVGHRAHVAAGTSCPENGSTLIKFLKNLASHSGTITPPLLSLLELLTAAVMVLQITLVNQLWCILNVFEMIE